MKGRRRDDEKYVEDRKKRQDETRFKSRSAERSRRNVENSCERKERRHHDECKKHKVEDEQGEVEREKDKHDDRRREEMREERRRLEEDERTRRENQRKLEELERLKRKEMKRLEELKKLEAQKRKEENERMLLLQEELKKEEERKRVLQEQQVLHENIGKNIVNLVAETDNMHQEVGKAMMNLQRGFSFDSSKQMQLLELGNDLSELRKRFEACQQKWRAADSIRQKLASDRQAQESKQVVWEYLHKLRQQRKDTSEQKWAQAMGKSLFKLQKRIKSPHTEILSDSDSADEKGNVPAIKEEENEGTTSPEPPEGVWELKKKRKRLSRRSSSSKSKKKKVQTSSSEMLGKNPADEEDGVGATGRSLASVVPVQ